MAVFSDLPVYDNTALMWLRLLFGSVMVAGLVLGLLAVLRRDIRTHQRWMARAYAVAQGAGTQALVLGPMASSSRASRAATSRRPGWAFAWVLNLAVAEWLVRRSQSPSAGLIEAAGST